MKRKIAAILSTIALAVTTTGLLTPAAHAATGTITVNIFSQTCKYTASKSGSAKAVNGSPSCNMVRAQLSYISSAGNVYTTPWKTSGGTAEWDVPAGTSYFSGKTGGMLKPMGTDV